MAINLTKPVQKAKLTTDQVIFLEGQVPGGILLIHKGNIDLFCLKKNSDLSDLTEENLDKTTILLWTLTDNMICGDISVTLNIPSPYSARASSESIVSIYPIAPSQFRQLIEKKPNLGIMIARSMIRQLMDSLNKMKSYNGLLFLLERTNDNLGLLLYKFDGMRFLQEENNPQAQANPTKGISSFLSEGMKKIDKYFSGGNSIPENVSSDFLNRDFSKIFGCKYGEDITEDNIKALFYKRFFSMPSGYQNTFFDKNYELLGFVCCELGSLLVKKKKIISGMFNKIYDNLKKIAGKDESWFVEFVSLFEKNRIENDPLKKESVNSLFKALLDECKRYIVKFEMDWGMPFRDKDHRIDTFYNQMEELGNDVDSAQEAKAEDSAGVTTVAESNRQLIEGDLKDSLQKIIAYSGIDNDTAMNFLRLWSDFGNVKNKMDSDSALRKMRRSLSKVYWDMYAKSFIKSIKTNSTPKYIDLMFRFGFIDEQSINPDAIGTIYRFQDNTQGKYVTYSIDSWLRNIYEENVNPSITELGQTYFEVLKSELRGANNIKLSKIERLPNDKSEVRLQTEIEHMLANGVMTSAGSIGSAFPILIRDLLPPNIQDIFITKKKISDIVDELIEIDFSLFYREILFKGDDGSRQYQEFVKKEVLPLFILLPSVGHKSSMWQEMDGKNKESPARFLVPTVPNGQLREMLIEAFGTFRWELIRSIAGAGWADATAFILTSDYFDYQEFYKKNSKLSQEAKEKLSMDFKKFRDPRSRFVNDYKQWIMYEKDGIPKMNKAAREVFIKHVPFHKKRKETLHTFPVFTNLLDRYGNINKRKKRELENRYFKYTKNGISLPEPLKKNIEFYDI